MDVDDVAMLQEWRVDPATGKTGPAMRAMSEPNSSTVNGKVFPATETVKKGLRVWIRFIRADQFTHPMPLHGFPFTVVASDGFPGPRERVGSGGAGVPHVVRRFPSPPEAAAAPARPRVLAGPMFIGGFVAGRDRVETGSILARRLRRRLWMRLRILGRVTILVAIVVIGGLALCLFDHADAASGDLCTSSFVGTIGLLLAVPLSMGDRFLSAPAPGYRLFTPDLPSPPPRT
ncbi:MAG: multicopper oxidase domain-containing protein [candidate division NC10 bacterium]|nr:multicopper oxidase domain-containing protein [candidate division NC10 bacterium]